MKLHQKSGSVTSGATGIPHSVPRAAFGFGSMIKKKKTPVAAKTPKKPTMPTTSFGDITLQQELDDANRRISALQQELDDANRRISVAKAALSHVSTSIRSLQKFANAVPTNMRSNFQTSIDRAIQATGDARTGLELSRRPITTPGFGNLMPVGGDASILPIGPTIPLRTKLGWASIPENWGPV